MSAIFGLIHWDGRPADANRLSAMNTALAMHGPDSHGLWIDGDVALGQRQSFVTAEDRFERQPRKCADGRMLVSDARVDNRDELLRAWSIAPGEAATWPDSNLVGGAIERHGAEGASHLVGAFAFAAWDSQTRQLMLARSPMSERPLFYHSTPETLAFASMPKALFAIGLGRSLDEEFLADYLSFERTEPGATFYRGIRRVPAGHVLIVTRDSSRSHAIWPPTWRERRFAKDADYVEAFLEVYTSAVRSALRSDGPVGLMMSGGFDSSSVGALAAVELARDGKRLAAFTEVPRRGFSGHILGGRYADETSSVTAIAKRYPNIDLNFVRTDRRFFLDSDLDGAFAAAERPFREPSNLVWYDALMHDAQQQGVRVLLGGFLGNYTVSWTGMGLLPQLLQRGRWLDALREAGLIAKRQGLSPLRVLAAQGVMPCLPTPIYSALMKVRRTPPLAISAVNPAFAAACNVAARARALGPDFRTRLRPDTRDARWRWLDRVAEVHDGVFTGCHARFGTEVRDPTADLRLVQFCLSIPEDQYLRDGVSRWLIRRAMANRLPDEVLQNPRRGLQAADWFERMSDSRQRMTEALDDIATSPLASRAIDVPRLRRLVAELSPASPASYKTHEQYRGALESGLMVGTFIRWSESANRLRHVS